MRYLDGSLDCKTYLSMNLPGKLSIIGLLDLGQLGLSVILTGLICIKAVYGDLFFNPTCRNINLLEI